MHASDLLLLLAGLSILSTLLLLSPITLSCLAVIISFGFELMIPLLIASPDNILRQAHTILLLSTATKSIVAASVIVILLERVLE